MARIVVRPALSQDPGQGQILKPQDFELYIQRTNDDGSNVNTRHFRLDNNYTCEHHLVAGDLIGVTYLGVTQNITFSDLPSDIGSVTQPVPDTIDNSKDLNVYIKGAPEKVYPNGVTNTVVNNDVGVNLKSFNIAQPFEVKLTPSTGAPTKDEAFWEVINSHQLDFKHYRNFIDEVLTSYPPSLNFSAGGKNAAGLKSPKDLSSVLYPDATYQPNANPHYFSNEEKKADSRRLPFNRTEAYSLLKFATERYVEYVYNLKNFLDEEDDEKRKFGLGDYVGKDQIIPYYDLVKSKIKEYFRGDHGKQAGFLQAHADTTLIELIWNYWYEEGMVGQTINAIAKRFQNIKNGYKDPLLNFALDPLRPLNNILWGYIQDAQHRLSPTRLNYEFTSEYDLCVLSTMKPGFNPADRRSKFLQSFHRLIYEATEYFVQSDNTTIRPDGFKLLNALRDTHRILAEGANNQFGDLPTVARIEMLIAQWILSRSEIREFLGGRVMVPYEEPWMDRVDSMKALQGWDNTSISFYRDLAVYGEKIILGVRNGNWAVITRRDHATNWADAFRDAIQRYIHSYYTVTGIDLSAPNVNINSEEKYLLPGMLIRQKYITERAGRRPFQRRY